ncbi:MaoC family dehydratase [Rhodococcus sp. BP-149]|jgi:acyl dehydratase|uniref:MaoC family dehydratase n=1 Tax=unclassified Rhodococcus (in: high G+C Gram-positive bacteria) TaxID=192944 RepID=UPI001C9A8BF5|nr:MULTISPECIES: MaoC family dehydratase [unclassified Rhodococcus (in: high G+C Gram-positive bacteria)]MBY6685649.1 MaoC family dehydratase [Rhodococcus sp. BP-288]MBY6694803.1 MaoC family dehydratase [Rhodococcus sp. BP-188]MBY6696649.1 MaoC family dehydratase [Rhodococcus sp. BP-285]MBY6703305.1 MaoC family dehydratase [Rhodococcus sp. BP-283]MBY6708628.1 MaoC family dehydratase [Rhodococcus sp. BP-241]
MTTRIATLAELKSLVGTELGTSSWIDVPQQRIDTFADATDDHQWIHVDPVRAAAESPFGGPVAHGYLTLSLIIPMWEELLVVGDVTTKINYGLNKVRFVSPVPAGGRVRLAAVVTAYDELAENGAQVTIAATIELEGSRRPAVVAEAVHRMFA